MQRRVQSKVKGVIGRITTDNQFLARQGYLPASIPHLKESAGFGKIAKMEMVGASPFRLEGRARRRKQTLAARYGIGNVQFGVENINRRIFENGRHRKI